MSARGFTVCVVTEIRRAGKGMPAYLEGGPLDGDELDIGLLGAGVIASRAVPDGCGATRVVDYFYRKTRDRRLDGRVVCRYEGVRSRV
jgi:hypothetical protein